MEGDYKSMRYLDDIYMESVFPKNYNILIKENTETAVEDSLIRFKNIFIRIHKGLMKLKKLDIYADVCSQILDYLKPVREYLRINLRKDVEDDIKSYLKTATPQQIAIDINAALTSYHLELSRLHRFYELENNQKMIDTLSSVDSRTRTAHASFEHILKSLLNR